MLSVPAISVAFSSHALRQAQRRGVSSQTMDLVLLHHDRSRKLPGLARALWVSRRRRNKLIEGGARASDVERAAGVRLIISIRDDEVLTVEHTTAHRRWA